MVERSARIRRGVARIRQGFSGRAFLLVSLFLALFPAAAQAGIQWRTPQTVSGAGAFSPRVAVSAQGTAIAVWIGSDGSTNRAQVSVRPSGGDFGPAQAVSDPGQNITHPEVAMDPQGDAVVVWSLDVPNPGFDRVQASYRPAGGATIFGSPETLSADGGNGFDPDVSMDDQGNAQAIWARGSVVQSSFRPAGPTSSFGPPATVSSPIGTLVQGYEPEIAAESNADAVAVWSRVDNSVNLIQAAERRAPSYEEPQSATNLQVPLVPVFKQCGTGANQPTKAHSSPLSVGSCAPATTPGAVAHVGANGVGSAQLTAIPGNFATPGNEADFSILVNATDIRSGSRTGPDYNPNAGGPDLTYNARLRITDSNNGAFPVDPATSTDLDFPVPVDCTTTVGTDGSTCTANTSANAVSPGTVIEGRDMIIQVFRARLSDAGPNGIQGDSDDKLFETQGFFVP
jgi:hypothetical protein